MMTCRHRHRHHHHKPPSKHRLHHTGTAAEEDPMMIHQSHRDDDDDDRMRRPVVHLHPNVVARLMGVEVDAVVPTTPPPPPPTPTKAAAAGTVHVQFQAQRRRRTSGNGDDAEYSGSSSRLCLNTMMTMRVPGSRWCPRPRHHHHRKKMARYGLIIGVGFGQGKGTTRQHDDDELPLIRNKQNKNGGVAQGECGDLSSSEHAAAAASEPAAMPDDSVVVVPRAPAAAAPAEESRDLPEASAAQELPRQRHTPILLLKPATTCSESDCGIAIGGGGGQKTKTLLPGLPKLHRDANMSVLLQEVKDRVQRELTVLTATTTTGCGEHIKAPASALGILLPPLQQVAKEDRGNKRLFRSESFRAFRRDRKRNASPDEAHILRSETAVMSPEMADGEECLRDASLTTVVRPGVGGVTDDQTFRSEYLTTKHRDDATASSPRLLFRSFSAPESGFASSIGRLFSFKLNEASEPSTAAAAVTTVTSKSVVSASDFSSFIRGTVSNLRRYGFRSRRNLLMFRRKRNSHWSWSKSNKTTSLGAGEIHPAKMEMPICPPSQETFNLFKVAQANLSELPSSPVSPLEVAGGHSSRHIFTDLQITLPPELSPKCLSEFEAPAAASESESSFRTDITAVETACSRDKAYITEVLIAAGLYDDDDDGPSAAANGRVDSMARAMAICDDIFEDVEDMYYYRGDYIVGGGIMFHGTDHRMLFDLANEALQSLVVAESSRAAGSSSSSLRRWVVDSTGVPRGKKLVDDVWHKVQALRNNPQAQEMQTIEGMVAYEVRRSVWAEVLYEDVYAVGRKIERAIFDELIQDLLHELEIFIW